MRQKGTKTSRVRPFAVAAAATLLAASVAQAEPRVETNFDLDRADEAARAMMLALHGPEVEFHLPSEIVGRLRYLGYRDFRDFDIEPDEYEVEATSPLGHDVEVKLDPVTGAIRDTDVNFL